MENSEEILLSLEEFNRTKPKMIPLELEEYLGFVAETGNPVFQWATVKNFIREKIISVITEFYQTSKEVPTCPNVEVFNYDIMKTLILEKFDTLEAVPFTLQRMCELLTTPRKEYNRIDKYMRALEKSIVKPVDENGAGFMSDLESESSDNYIETISGSDVEEEDDDDDDDGEDDVWVLRPLLEKEIEIDRRWRNARARTAGGQNQGAFVASTSQDQDIVTIIIDD